MNFNKLKKLLIVYIVLLTFIASFALIFGSKNITIPIIIILTTVMTLRTNLSVSPRISFLKILVVFWACALIAFINAPNNWLGLVLGFLLIFAITFSSFHVLTSDSHIAYVMAYIMMMCVPVSFEGLLLRLLALAVGALLIVLLNTFVHRSKRYTSRDELIQDLIDELNNVVCAKLENKEYESNIGHINGNLNSILFENLGYKYINNYVRETSTTLCKTALYLEKLIKESNLSVDELKLIREEIVNLAKKGNITLHSNNPKTRDICLNLKIMKREITIKDERLSNDINVKAIQSFFKSNFSLSSLKFSFAIKLAFLISLWESLGLLFDLPYVKWLYFSSLVLLVPYMDNFKDKSVNGIKSTSLGLIIFTAMMILFYSDYSIFNLLKISISASTISTVFLLVLIFVLLIVFKDSFKRTILTTVLSLITALKYINLDMAVPLKISWLLVSLVLAYVLTMYILPYSVKDETRNSLFINNSLGEQLIDLLSKQASTDERIPKSGLVVSSNVMINHINLNNESLKNPLITELTTIQRNVVVFCDFLLNNMQLKLFSSSAKEKIKLILQGEDVEITSDMNYDEILSIYTTKDIVNFREKEEKLLSDYEQGE